MARVNQCRALQSAQVWQQHIWPLRMPPSIHTRRSPTAATMAAAQHRRGCAIELAPTVVAATTMASAPHCAASTASSTSMMPTKNQLATPLLFHPAITGPDRRGSNRFVGPRGPVNPCPTRPSHGPPGCGRRRCVAAMPRHQRAWSIRLTMLQRVGAGAVRPF